MAGKIINLDLLSKYNSSLLGKVNDERVSKSGDTMTGSLRVNSEDIVTGGQKDIVYTLNQGTLTTSGDNVVVVDGLKAGETTCKVEIGADNTISASGTLPLTVEGAYNSYYTDVTFIIKEVTSDGQVVINCEQYYDGPDSELSDEVIFGGFAGTITFTQNQEIPCDISTGSLGANKVIIESDPTEDKEAVRKGYVDSVANNLTDIISKKVDKTELDTALSKTSENAVQNKVITEEFNKKANKNEIPYLPIGTIIQSAIPLDDAGVLLLAGQTIAQDGIYADFVSLVKSKVAQGYPLSCSEDEFTQAINTTGNCGKFVIDDSANTMRIPRITRFVQGLTNLDTLSDIGESESAGLPNITGSFQLGNHASTNTTATGAFTSTEGTNASYTGVSSNARSRTDIEFNASVSSSIYGNSDTVQPEATKFPYYIVVANNYKTDTQVNIDNITSEIERLDTECVKTTGVQTIGGDKNFTGALYKNGYPVDTVTSNKLSNLLTTTSGYVSLGSGLIIQWFTAKLGSNTTVTLPTGFRSTNYVVLGTPVSTDSSNVITFKIRSRTTTSFAGLGLWCASNSQGTLGSDITFAFIAIGY